MSVHRPEARAVFDGALLSRALRDSVVKLDPRQLVRNPVMFVTALVALVATVLSLRDLMSGAADPWLPIQLCVWLWITVLFGNFAEAIAEGRGKAQAASLRRTKTEAKAKKVPGLDATGA